MSIKELKKIIDILIEHDPDIEITKDDYELKFWLSGNCNYPDQEIINKLEKRGCSFSEDSPEGEYFFVFL